MATKILFTNKTINYSAYIVCLKFIENIFQIVLTFLNLQSKLLSQIIKKNYGKQSKQFEEI